MSDEEVKRLRERYLEIKKRREGFEFHLHRKLRFPLSWTLFFIILGLIHEYIITKSFAIKEFFSVSYLNWFSSFGNLVETYNISGFSELSLLILRQWYYFFITGGIIAIIWAIISIITHMEIKKKDEFRAGQI